MRRITSVAALALLVLPLTWAGTAQARVVYTTEEGVTNSNSFTIDVDDSSSDDGTDIVLEFGDGGETITYDNTNNLFTISDDLDFGGNQAQNMVLYSGTDTAGVAVPAEGMVFWDTDDDTVYVYDSNTTTWIPIGGLAGGNADTLDTLDSTQFLRSDTSDNYTSGTLTFDSGTTLTGATGSTADFDDANVNIDGINNATLTLNEDGAGAEDVTLQFGGTLAETITVDNATGDFQFSDDIAVTGDVSATGTLSQDGNDFNLNDDADVDANVSIVANQNTTAETGILRYNATTDEWEISSDNGTTYNTVATDATTNTLDQAYDQGGAGAGRTIAADNGAVEINGDGLDVDDVIINDSSIATTTGTNTDLTIAPDGTGQVNVTSTSLTLDSDSAVDANVELIANQNTTAETGILRYNATTDRWEISSDNGSTYDNVATAGTRSDKLAAEYPNMTLIEEDGAGVDSGNHRGTLISERDGTEDMNYYSWEARRTALHDYTIAVEWYIPENFDSWQGTDSVSLRYLTEDPDPTDNNVSVWVVNNAGTTVASSLTNANTSWTDIDLDLTAGTFNPGEHVTVFVTLRSRRDGGVGGGNPRHARVGDLTFNYNSL